MNGKFFQYRVNIIIQYCIPGLVLHSFLDKSNFEYSIVPNF